MERYVAVLSQKLSDRGHIVSVFTMCNVMPSGTTVTGRHKVIRAAGIFDKFPFIHGNPAELNLPPLPDVTLAYDLDRVIVEAKPDVINVQGWILYSLLLARGHLSVPIVVTLHDYRLICPKATMLRCGRLCEKPLTFDCIACSKDAYNLLQAPLAYACVKLQRGQLRRADKVISVSTFVKHVHQKYVGLSDEEITVIPNFYDKKSKVFSSGMSSGGDLPNNYVLYVGLLSPFKGVDVVIKAFESIADSDLKLVLIGKRTPEKQYHSSKNVIIIENPPDKFVKRAYDNCRFVVVPSVWPDPCPTVAFEAMAAGKAVVAAASGGLTDIVLDGVTGYLVPPDDVVALKLAIERVAADPVLATQMGDAGRKRMTTHFSSEAVVPRLEKLFESVRSRR